MNSIIVIDNFFDDPISVRNFALSQQYTHNWYSTALRTETLSKIEPEFYNSFAQKLMRKISDRGVSDLMMDLTFQYSPEYYNIGVPSSHIHTDKSEECDFTVLVYLNPSSFGRGRFGTAFYELDEAKITSYDYFLQNKLNDMLAGKRIYCSQASTMSKEEKDKATELIKEHDSHFRLVDYASNIFNRCVIFPAHRFHDAVGYFGKDKFDSRLVLIGFAKIHREGVSHFHTEK